MKSRKMNISTGIVLLLTVTITPPDTAMAGGNAGAAFSKGAVSYNIALGSGSAFNDNYTIFGLGVSYYVINGLALGIDAEHWFSGNPSITTLSPQVRYVLTQTTAVKPYVGAFYRRTYIEDLVDADSFGYRAGAYFSGNNGVYFGGGVVYEEYKDCKFDDCSRSYPELLVSVSF